MKLQPLIDYAHVLRELSVNRDDPCEIIRELISNSYDAQATEILYFPLLDLRGFVFWDNGEGMATKPKQAKVSAYQAFFSIGLSTRSKGGQTIGYKCQGSKLCFACNKFALITRCKGEHKWRFKKVDDPRNTLSNPKENDISPESTDTPSNSLESLLGSSLHQDTRKILEHLNMDFFKQHFKSGSMIVVIGLDLTNEEFTRHFSTVSEKGADYSYLYNFIRLSTCHGDVRVLNEKRTGFTPVQKEKLKPDRTSANLKIWIPDGLGISDSDGNQQIVRNELVEVPCGFWYLDTPQQEFKTPNAPVAEQRVHQLDGARFCARFANRFQIGSDIYRWVLAIDGNRKSQDGYYSLDRQGKGGGKSGYPLRKVRGSYIASSGIKVAGVADFFEQLSDYSILTEPTAFKHYLFIIDGPFELTANRNGVTTRDLEKIKSDEFRSKFLQSLESAKINAGPVGNLQIQHKTVFDELIERLKKTIQEGDLNKELTKIRRLKAEMSARCVFKINSGALQGRTFPCPDVNEENWVGALYSMFSLFVDLKGPWADLWLRPVNMSGVSIDALALPLAENNFQGDPFKTVEYKYSFSRTDEFNHPFLGTDYVVCWQFSDDDGELGRKKDVQDKFRWHGEAQPPNRMSPSGKPVSYEITSLWEKGKFDDKLKRTIKVISLRELIDVTFQPTWYEP
ncbi:MAG: hypothetical protein ACLQPD_29240 [Desulfomonilaceae bacterium]